MSNQSLNDVGARCEPWFHQWGKWSCPGRCMLTSKTHTSQPEEWRQHEINKTNNNGDDDDNNNNINDLNLDINR